MHRTLPESSGDVLGVVIEERLTRDDVEEIQAGIRAVIQEHGSIRLLMRVDGLQGVEPSAVWQDLKMVPTYVRTIERLAVIGDERWHTWTSKAAKTFTDAAFFQPAESEQAWRWLREGG